MYRPHPRLNKLFRLRPGPPDHVLEEMIYQAGRNLHSSFLAREIIGLEAGCGRRSPLYKVLLKNYSLASHIVGVDLDEEDLKVNLELDSKVRASLFSLPFRNQSVDLINCRFVFEHLPEPEKVLDEFHRVLKEGGYLMFWTVNKWNYAMIFSRLSPHWFHNLMRRISFGAREDNLPTYYRLNTVKELEKSLERHGFRKIKIFYRGGAYLYLQLTALTYFFGLLMNLVGQSPFFRRWQLFILGFYQKTSKNFLESQGGDASSGDQVREGMGDS